MQVKKQFPPIMKDERLEKQLLDDGYIVLKKFLSPERVADLLEYNRNNQPEFHADHIINSVWHTRDEDYKVRTIAKIIDVYTPPCNEVFTNYQIFGGSFVIKPPFGKGASQPHIDYGIVNEDKFRSFNLWIPLVKLTPENGPLQVLKGSHNIRNIFRGPNIPDQTVELREYFWKECTELLLDAGDALLYDHRAVHCSRENHSTEPRIATSCALTSAGAPMMVYFWNDDRKKIQGFQIELDYLMKNNHGNLPVDMQPVQEWDYSFDQISMRDLEPVREPIGFKQKLLRLFGQA